MQNLYKKLEKYSIKDALKIEKSDLQYKALEELFSKLQNNNLFYALIIANSIICYQLSSTGENYWQEFSLKSQKYFSKKQVKNGDEIIDFFKKFLPNSKGNIRFINTKLNRLEKIKGFLDKFLDNGDSFVDNLVKLRNEIAINLKQKNDAKTIVFTIKMIWYGINIVYDFSDAGNIKKPDYTSLMQICIPLDSRLTNIFEIYKEKYTDIRLFYDDLSKKLKIPQINLDAIIWVNYKELIKG